MADFSLDFSVETARVVFCRVYLLAAAIMLLCTFLCRRNGERNLCCAMRAVLLYGTFACMYNYSVNTRYRYLTMSSVESECEIQ